MRSMFTLESLTGNVNFDEFIIYLVSFSEGLTYLATLSVYYLFKDDLNFSPPQLTLVFTALDFPWLFRTFISFFIDYFSFGPRPKRSYLMFFSTFQVFGFLGLSFASDSVFACVVSLIVISTSSAFCITVAESMIVNNAEGDSKKSSELVGNLITAKALAHLLVAYFSGYLLEYISKNSPPDRGEEEGYPEEGTRHDSGLEDHYQGQSRRGAGVPPALQGASIHILYLPHLYISNLGIFMITAIFPTMITILSFFMVERPSMKKQWPGFQSQLRKVLDFIFSPKLFPKVLYIFLCTSSPGYDEALFFFGTNVLHFGSSFMGLLRLTFSLSALFGVQLYKKFFWRYNFKSIIYGTNIIVLPLFISPILLVTRLNLKMNISDRVFILTGGFILEAAFEVQLLPLLSHIAKTCPRHLESSVLAALLNVRYIGKGIRNISTFLLSYMLGITSTNFDHLPALIIICSVLLSLPLFIVPRMSRENDPEEGDDLAPGIRGEPIESYDDVQESV